MLNQSDGEHRHGTARDVRCAEGTVRDMRGVNIAQSDRKEEE